MLDFSPSQIGVPITRMSAASTRSLDRRPVVARRSRARSCPARRRAASRGRRAGPRRSSTPLAAHDRDRVVHQRLRCWTARRRRLQRAVDEQRAQIGEVVLGHGSLSSTVRRRSSHPRRGHGRGSRQDANWLVDQANVTEESGMANEQKATSKPQRLPRRARSRSPSTSCSSPTRAHWAGRPAARALQAAARPSARSTGRAEITRVPGGGRLLVGDHGRRRPRRQPRLADLLVGARGSPR